MARPTSLRSTCPPLLDVIMSITGAQGLRRTKVCRPATAGASPLQLRTTETRRFCRKLRRYLDGVVGWWGN